MERWLLIQLRVIAFGIVGLAGLMKRVKLPKLGQSGFRHILSQCRGRAAIGFDLPLLGESAELLFVILFCLSLCLLYLTGCGPIAAGDKDPVEVDTQRGGESDAMVPAGEAAGPAWR